MQIVNSDVVVVGCGPAGIAAATRVAERGARVLLLDSAPTPGGHLYKQPPTRITGPLDAHHASILRELDARLAALARYPVDIRYGATVWGAFRGEGATFDDQDDAPDDHGQFTLYLENTDQPPCAVHTSAIIVAPGVYDRLFPFPGWTLPGVVTPGAIDYLGKTQGIIVGQRVLVAGTGPLQMAVAATLAGQGAEVVALIDTCAATDALLEIPGAMWGQWQRIVEMAGYGAALLRHRVPMLFGHAVVRAEGTPEGGVAGAVVAAVDPDGHPIRGTERSYAIDTLCIAYGFAPSIELPLHLGCAHDFDPCVGLYFPRADDGMATTVPGVFVAGDVTGAGGKDLAALQGQVAGISALARLGRVTLAAANELRAQLQPAIRRQQRFGRMLWDRFRVRPGLVDLVQDDTLICRCEGVTAAQIKASAADGALDFRGAKLRTRVGMGVCQGRYCFANAAMLLARERGCTVPEIGLPHIRPPVVPVRARDLFAAPEP